jgi:hypothetical protein
VIAQLGIILFLLFSDVDELRYLANYRTHDFVLASSLQGIVFLFCVICCANTGGKLHFCVLGSLQAL